jgi:NADPH-dependent curcumin reductase CurA
MTQTNRKTIFSVLMATIAATSIIALSGSELSFAVLDRTLGHLDGVDDTVKDVGDDVADLEHDVGDSVDNVGENVGDILRGDD